MSSADVAIVLAGGLQGLREGEGSCRDGQWVGGSVGVHLGPCSAPGLPEVTV